MGVNAANHHWLINIPWHKLMGFSRVLNVFVEPNEFNIICRAFYLCFIVINYLNYIILLAIL